VLAVDYRPMMGGIAAYTEEAAARFSRLGTIVLVAPWMRGCRAIDARQSFRTVRVIPLWGLRELSFGLALAYYRLRWGSRTALAQVWFPCGVVAFALARLLGMRYASIAFGSDYIDDTLTFRRRIKALLARLKTRVFNASSVVIAISAYSADKLSAMGVRQERIRMITPGVDIQRFSPGAADAGFAPRYQTAGRRMLLTVARLERYKGHDTVISLMPRLIERHPDLYYYIAGDGPARQELEALAAEAGISSRVVFTGFVPADDIISFYRACAIFVMLSRAEDALVEGFGLCFVEAAACGAAVVGGRSGGTPDAVADNVSGILVNPTDTDEVFARIHGLLADPAAAVALGRSARAWVEKERGWERAAARMWEVIRP